MALGEADSLTESIVRAVVNSVYGEGSATDRNLLTIATRLSGTADALAKDSSTVIRGDFTRRPPTVGSNPAYVDPQTWSINITQEGFEYSDEYLAEALFHEGDHAAWKTRSFHIGDQSLGTTGEAYRESARAAARAEASRFMTESTFPHLIGDPAFLDCLSGPNIC